MKRPLNHSTALVFLLWLISMPVFAAASSSATHCQQKEHSTEAPQKIFKAAQALNLEMVKACLDAGGSLQERDEEGFSLLYHVIENPNKRDHEIASFLGQLIKLAGNKVDSVPKWLNAPINNGPISFGSRAAHVAAANDQSITLQTLTEGGANIHITDMNQNTPMVLAETFNAKKTQAFIRKQGSTAKRKRTSKSLASKKQARTTPTIRVSSPQTLEKLLSELDIGYYETRHSYHELIRNYHWTMCLRLHVSNDCFGGVPSAATYLSEQDIKSRISNLHRQLDLLTNTLRTLEEWVDTPTTDLEISLTNIVEIEAARGVVETQTKELCSNLPVLLDRLQEFEELFGALERDNFSRYELEPQN